MDAAQRNRESARLGPAVLRLLGGSLGGQCLLLLAAPVLSRLYSPTEFGVFGVFFSLVATGTTIGSLRYEMAIVLARRPATIQRLFWAVVAIAAVMSTVLAISLAGVPALSRWLFPTDHLDHVWWLLPVALWIHIVMLAITRVASKLDAFGSLGMAVLVGRSADLAVKVALAGNMDWHGLALGMVAGDVVSIAVAMIATPKLLSAPPANLSRYVAALRQFRHFPLYNLPSALGSALARAIPVIGLATLFGPVTAGCYEMASRALGRPSALVGNQFYTVFYPKTVARLARGGSASGIVESWMPRLLVLFAPPFLLVALFGQPLFVLVFGAEWANAGRYAAILAPAWYLGGVAIPIRMFNTLNEQRLALVWQGSVVLATLAAIGVGAALGSDMTTVALISAVWTIAYLVHLRLTVKLSGADPNRIWSGLLHPWRSLPGRSIAAGGPSEVVASLESEPARPLRRSA